MTTETQEKPIKKAKVNGPSDPTKILMKVFNTARKSLKRYDPTINDFQSDRPIAIMQEVYNDGDYIRVLEFSNDYNFTTYSPVLTEYVNETFMGDMKEDPEGIYFKFSDVQDMAKDIILWRAIEKFSTMGYKLTKEFIDTLLKYAKHKSAAAVFKQLEMHDGVYLLSDIKNALAR